MGFYFGNLPGAVYICQEPATKSSEDLKFLTKIGHPFLEMQRIFVTCLISDVIKSRKTLFSLQNPIIDDIKVLQFSVVKRAQTLSSYKKTFYINLLYV